MARTQVTKRSSWSLGPRLRAMADWFGQTWSRGARPRSPVLLVASLIATALALWPILTFLDVALARITYPFDIEWMETATVDHVRVVLAGEPLYRRPSVDFIPFIYTPFYYLVSAAVAKVVGIGLFPLRLVSLVSTVGSFALLVYWVSKETGDRVSGVVAAGLFAATFSLAEAWFDLARVDSLHLFLVLAAMVLSRFTRHTFGSVAVAAMLVLALMTKQVAVLMAIPALAHRLVKCPRQGVFAGFAFCTLLGLVVWWMEASSGGWFSFYVYRLPSQHPVSWNLAWDRFDDFLWSPVAPMALASLAVVVGGLGTRTLSGWVLYAGFVLTATGSSFSALLHSGSYPNVLMPGYAAMAVASGLLFADLRRRAADSTINTQLRLSVLGVGLVVLQLWLTPDYPRSRLVPTERDRVAGNRFLSALREYPGPVWIVSRGYYSLATHGQKEVTTHAMGPVDVLKSHETEIAQALHEELLATIRTQRFGTIVVDNTFGLLSPALTAELRRHYSLESVLFREGDASLMPKVGAAVRPDAIWVRRQAQSRP